MIEHSEEEEEQYFIFKLGGQMYGTPLSDIAEVIEPQTAKWVPHMREWFRGVINLRGKVVGVIDLRARFGIDTANSKCSLVFETAQGPLVAMIDEGIAVRYFKHSEVEKHPHIKLKVPTAFLIGFGNHDGEMVTLVRLNEILSSDELVDISKAQKIV